MGEPVRNAAVAVVMVRGGEVLRHARLLRERRSWSDSQSNRPVVCQIGRAAGQLPIVSRSGL